MTASTAPWPVPTQGSYIISKDRTKIFRIRAILSVKPAPSGSIYTHGTSIPDKVSLLPVWNFATGRRGRGRYHVSFDEFYPLTKSLISNILLDIKQNIDILRQLEANIK
jgi:hypothetical protein